VSKKEPPWIRLPLLALKDEELTLSDAVVLSVIIDRADATSCKLSYSDIAEVACISERAVQRSVQSLERAGYISRKRESTGSVSVYKQYALFPKKRGNKKATEQESYIQSLIDSGMSLEDAMKAYAIKLKNKFKEE